MKRPWVSRALLDNVRAELQHERGRVADAHERSGWFIKELGNAVARIDIQDARYDALLEKYHALRVAGANAPEPVPAPVVIPEPDQPPPAVLAAMQRISPVRDKTYEANWVFWELNKDRAAAHPDAFADEIIAGAADWTPSVKTYDWADLPAG